MAVADSDINALLDSYREARAAILVLPDGLEREIGLATHRLEIRDFERTLRTSATGISDPARRTLKEYADALEGGGSAEAAAKWLDQGAKKVLTDLTHFLLHGIAMGAVAFVLGVLGTVLNAAEAVGEGLALIIGWIGVLGGFGLFLMHRALFYGVIGANESWVASFNWARHLGRQADAAMAPVRLRETAVWQQATGHPNYLFSTFTGKARSRAYSLVALAWLLLISGALLIGYETLEALSQPEEPVFEFPTGITP